MHDFQADILNGVNRKNSDTNDERRVLLQLPGAAAGCIGAISGILVGIRVQGGIRSQGLTPTSNLAEA